MRVYLIRNTLNGKAYIGQTRNSLTKRMYGHVADAVRGKDTLLAKALRKYGKENFAITELHACTTREEADALEREYIALYSSLVPYGYNLAKGGNGFDQHSDVTKQKMSGQRRGNPQHPNTAKALVESNRRRVWTPEMRAKLTIAQSGNKKALGRVRPETERRAIGDAQRGSRNHTARFTDAQVLVIREKYQSGSRVTALSREYGVAHPIISRIVNHVSY